MATKAKKKIIYFTIASRERGIVPLAGNYSVRRIKHGYIYSLEPDIANLRKGVEKWGTGELARIKLCAFVSEHSPSFYVKQGFAWKS